MNSKVIAWIVVIILIVIAVIAFVGGNGDNDEEPVENTATTTEDQVAQDLLNARYTFEDGEYVIVGEVQTPTPCHTVSVDPMVEDAGDRVVLDITTEEPADDEVCAQVISSQTFRVNVEANENAEIVARVDGREQRLNLIPAEEGENLEEMEVDIKG